MLKDLQASQNKLQVVETEYRKDVSLVEQRVLALEIKDADDVTEATNLLSYISSTKKNIEETRKSMVKPINDGLKAINDWFKRFSAPLETADGLLRKKVLVYRQQQEQIRRAEEERLRKLAEAEQKKLEKQAKKDGVMAPPPPPPVMIIPEQARTVHSDMGAVSAKLVWDFEIEDENKVPRNFMIVNEKAIRAAVKAGVRNIPGVKVFQKEELAVRAR